MSLISTSIMTKYGIIVDLPHLIEHMLSGLYIIGYVKGLKSGRNEYVACMTSCKN